MKFELGETVYSLHYDAEQEIYLKESLVIGIKANIVPDTYTDNLKCLLVDHELQLHPITFDDDCSKYVLSSQELDYYHTAHLVFRSKQEAVIYLHGIVSEVAK